MMLVEEWKVLEVGLFFEGLNDYVLENDNGVGYRELYKMRIMPRNYSRMHTAVTQG
jgi:hypothetical protein